MSDLPRAVTGEITLFIDERAGRTVMLELAAALALHGPLRVLDGGNSFDAYRVARLIRRHTVRLDSALQRLTVARAFTCYQVVTLCTAAPTCAAPQLVLDLPATFYDESVSVAESYRLLRLVVAQLERLRQHAPVVVSARPPRQPQRAGLLRLLVETADRLIIPDRPASKPPLRLFPIDRID